MKRLQVVLSMAALVAVAGASTSMLLTSCSASSTPVAVRTFERAGRVDVVCLKIANVNTDGTRVNIPPVPVPQAYCAPVATGADGSSLPYHLYALVTQTLRGEVAVVDLTASRVVDVSARQPGLNFMPVGANPTDIVVTPDGTMAFVASAEVNKPAIYGIPSARILGDSLLLTGLLPSTNLGEWPVCALPQAPGRMVVLPGPAGADGGAPGSQLAVVLPGDASSSAKLITIDIAPFLAQGSTGAIAPGSLAPCPITSAIELRGDVPASWTPGDAWPNGVPYVDGGVDLFQPIVPPPPPPPDGGADGGAGDAATDAAPPHGYDQLPVWAMSDASTTADAGNALPVTPGNVAHARGLAFDGKFLYVADDGLPLVHVIETTGGKLTELEPLLATSLATPARVVATTELAVSPPTHDYKRYLYALDQHDGSIITYDVTDPRSAVRTPMVRPNPELNPFQSPDRLRFSAPVTTFAFVRHDVPLEKTAEGPLTAAKSGLLCNPNRNVEPQEAAEQGPFHDPTGQNEDLALGAYYRANVAQRLTLGPGRLRGIFAFVTLSSGTVIPVDVDDWDAACRRPVLLNGKSRRSSLDITQRLPDPLDIDPYAVPETNLIRSGSTVSTTTEETIFPVSVPQRPRSLFLLKSDTTNGAHLPYVVGQAQLLESGAPLVLRAKGYPTLVAPLVKPDGLTDVSLLSEPNVRFSLEDPTVHFGQDWTLTYEGAIPGFDGVAGVLASDDGYQTLSMSNSSGLFCRRGVEDLRQGKARVAAMAAENPAYLAPRIADRLADYVQLTDEILPNTDPYWSLEPSSCWDIPLPNDPSRNLRTESPAARQQVCVDKFGAAANQSTQRDFPVLEAYEDHLVLGRYLYSDTTTRPANGRIVQGRDASNATDLKLAQCCFHNQARFAMRGGSQWVAVGTAVGFLHHVTADPSTHACVRSNVRREVLLNGRAIEFFSVDKDGKEILTGNVDRSSPFALRNPALSVALRASASTSPTTFTNSARDIQWKFSTLGSFTPLAINLAATTTAVVPQSMTYIDSIGRLAIVDGSSLGLILVDLDSVAVAGTSFF